jgi:ribosomal protein L9
LATIIVWLEDLNLPMHAEEIENGFHREFLKPEYLNWQQASTALLHAKQFESRANRNEREEREQEMRGKVCAT